MATNKAQDKNVVGQENVKMRVEQQEQIELVERRTLADMDDLDLENRNAAKPDDSDGKTDWHWRRVVAIVSLSGLYVSAQLPLQFAGGSMTYMDAEFRAGALTWLITGNNLSFAAMCPFAGYLADLLGAGLCIIVGVIIIGTANSFTQALVGEVIAGAGGGVCELTALAGVSETSPVRLRGFYLGFVTFFIVPFAPYLIYCELLGHYVTWRWMFWIILMYAGIWWLGVAFTYFPPTPVRTAGMKKREILKRLDYIGAALSIIGMTLFIVGLQDGGYRYAWNSYHVIVTLVVGILVIISFVIWEIYGAKHPMVPPAIFSSNRAVPAALLVATAGGIGLYSVLAFVPLLLQTLYPDESALTRGARGAGYGLSILLTATAMNMALSATGRARELLLASVAVMAAFTASLVRCTPFNPNYTTAMVTLAGFGIGGLIVPAATVAMICCPDSVISTVVGISLCVRTLGGALGTSIYTAIFQNKIQDALPQFIGKYAVDAGLPQASVTDFVTAYLADPLQASNMEGVTSAILEAASLGQRWAYADSLQYVWYAGLAFSLAAGVCCFFIPNLRPYLTNRVAVIH